MTATWNPQTTSLAENLDPEVDQSPYESAESLVPGPKSSGVLLPSPSYPSLSSSSAAPSCSLPSVDTSWPAPLGAPPVVAGAAPGRVLAPQPRRTWRTRRGRLAQ